MEKIESEELFVEELKPSVGLSYRQRLTPRLFKAYPVCRILVELLEPLAGHKAGENISCTLQAVPYDPEMGDEKLIAIYKSDVFGEAFYRVASSSADLLKGMRLIKSLDSNIKTWANGVFEIWQERDEQLEKAKSL